MTGTPDIPLREPLEFEYRLNRKLAKKLYHEENLQRVNKNKERCQSDKARRLQEMLSGYQQREVRYVQDRRQMEEWVRKRNEERQGQREVIAQKCQRIVTDRERELRERERRLQ